jgi:K+-transporting ATPase ATPase C chain
MWRHLKTATILYLALTVVTGVLYPLGVTAIAQIAMPARANGSLIARDGRMVGSTLIGQPFSSPGYFWSRPSATGPMPYNAAASSGSNLGPTNPALEEAVRESIAALRAADPGNQAPVPVDLVTASGSGLDPHISPAAAAFQVTRVARERGMDPARLRALVAEHTEGRSFWLLGERRVNVLTLNLALDTAADGAP